MPSLICTEDGARSMVISGVGIRQIEGANPRVLIGETEALVDSLEDCTSDMEGSVAWTVCSTIHVTVSEGALTEGRRI